MSQQDAELINEFVVESVDHLAEVERLLLQMEATSGDPDKDTVNNVFRAIHSIKGAAGFLELGSIDKLAHRAEDVLNRLRNAELTSSPIIVDALLQTVDCLKTMLADVERSNEADTSGPMDALQAILREHAGDSRSAAPTVREELPQDQELLAKSADCFDSPSNFETSEPAASAWDGQAASLLRDFTTDAHERLEQLDRDVLSLEQSFDDRLASSVMRHLHSIKGGAGFLGLVACERLAHASESLLASLRESGAIPTRQAVDSLLAALDAFRTMLSACELGRPTDLQDYEPLVKALERLAARKDDRPAERSSEAAPSFLSAKPAVERREEPKPGEAKTGRSSGADQSHGASESSIRVDVALLDKLMTRVGELVLARNQILQFCSSFNDAAFQSTSQRLNLITTELQESVMKTRMQPIGNVWGKFPRIVRDLAAACGKQVRIEMEGRETELDKTIIEAIKDPLTHLVRNSVDHGIEAPSVRVEAGKPAEGCLTLRAFHEGGQVNIEISDDGGGLNLDRIRQKAVERGLVGAEHVARMNDREAAQLIFLPGFSTAEQVTNVSGRGVGMDVVKTNIERIGGTVDLQTVWGRGCVVKIKIPLTLAIIPALIVTSGGDRYAIPQVNLLELVRLEGAQAARGIEWMHGSPVHRLRGRLLPLVYLNQEMSGEPAAKRGQAKGGENDIVNIVVLRADDRQFGLVVDRINDTEEIVVKPLGKQLKGVTLYAGATIMGDGRVALILDVLGLAHSARVVSESRDRSLSESATSERERKDGCQTLLILAVGRNRRVALPISMVSRLEEIPRGEIEQAENRAVVQYRGQILPLVRLGDVLGASRGDEGEDDRPLQVVVYSENGTSLGLIVDRVLDIVETTLDAKCIAQSEMLLGSAVINKHVTDLLDLPAVVRHAHPAFLKHGGIC